MIFSTDSSNRAAEVAANLIYIVTHKPLYILSIMYEADLVIKREVTHTELMVFIDQHKYNTLGESVSILIYSLDGTSIVPSDFYSQLPETRLHVNDVEIKTGKYGVWMPVITLEIHGSETKVCTRDFDWYTYPTSIVQWRPQTSEVTS